MLIHPWDAALDGTEWQDWVASAPRASNGDGSPRSGTGRRIATTHDACILRRGPLATERVSAATFHRRPQVSAAQATSAQPRAG
jgi:hypothetical protein